MISKIFLLTFSLIVSFSLIPLRSSKAEITNQLLLSPSESITLIDAVRYEISITSPNLNIFDYSAKEQAALSLFRASARKAVLSFLPSFVATETVKVVITLANVIVKASSITLGGLFNEIEKASVKEATDMGLNWLFQNKIKTGSGSIQNTYFNYEDQTTTENFQYLITYREINKDSGDLLLEFYSPDPVDAPVFRGSAGGAMGFVGDSASQGKIDPFIVHVEARMKHIALGWNVDSSVVRPRIVVEFPEKVPRLQLAKELPYPLEEKKREILNTINTVQRILKALESLGSKTAGRIGEVVDSVQAAAKKLIELLPQFRNITGAGVTLSSLEQSDIQQTQSVVQVVFDVQKIISDSVGEEINLVNSKEQEQVPEIVKEAVKEAVKETVKKTAKEDAKKDVKESPLQVNKDTKVQPLQPFAWCNIDRTQSPALSSVILYEIAWMGSANSANDEYMKLKNISNSEANLAGWQLQDKDSKIQIAFKKEHVISSQGIFVLERTNDDSLPGSNAHVIYMGALNNTNEGLYLFDQNCVLRDKVVANPAWPVGESTSKKPMQRNNDLGWHTSGVSVNPSPPPSPQPVLTYPKILISEVQTAGLSSQTEEFVELYNPTAGLVNVTDWHIQKKTQGADSFSAFASKNILSGKTIQTKGYFLIAREGSSFAAIADAFTSYSLGDNNTLALKNPDGTIADKIGWGDAQDAENTPAPNPQAGQSLNRVWDTVNQTYYDRDNNSIDFAARNPASPKAQNIEDRPSSPTPPPPPPPSPSPPPTTYLKILISEIQIEGESVKDEFVELYNSNGEPVNLTGWSLKRKTSTGSDANLVSAPAFSGTVGAYGYFLVVPQLNDDGTINYKGTATPDLFYSGKTFSVAPDNVIFLYNPNNELADKVGFGAATEAEGSPAPNPPANSSISRKFKNNVYQDTDNNAQDFQVQTPSPKIVNPVPAPSPAPPPPPPPPPPDTTAPQATFNSLGAAQTNIYFTISWSAQDEPGGSGLTSLFVQYTANPTSEGTLLQYQNNGVWTTWQQGTAGKLTLNSAIISLSLFARDGIAYTFEVKAKDVAGNESAPNTVSTTVSLPKTVVINEIAWAGTKASSNDEWLELYNPTSSLIDLTGWKVKSSDIGGPEITLTGGIAPQGLYLIERTNDLPTSLAANLIASFENGLSNTSCETLYLHNAQDTVVDQTACKADGSWPGGTAAPNYISLERINASNAGSDHANWASNNLLTHNGTDAGNNVVNGTPKTANSVSLSPTIDPDLRFSEFSTITLTLLGSPYLANNDVMVPAGKTLVVEPGVTVKFKNNNSHFTVDGTLNAVGQSSKQILFTNDTGNTSPWCALKFSPTSVNSVLEYVVVDHAGSTAASCGNSVAYAIFVDGSSITFKNSSITTGNGVRKVYLKNSNSVIDGTTISGAKFHDLSAAVYIEGGAPTIRNSTFSGNSIGIYNQGNPTISNNTFTSNTYPVELNALSATLSGNTATGNTYNGTFLDDSGIQNITLQADTMPYIMNSFTVNAGKTLTLQAGVVVKFVNLPSMPQPELVVLGTLLANGISGNPVVFTVLDDDTVGGVGSDTVVTPHWRGIRFQAGSAGSVLQNTVVKFGGNTSNQGALFVDNTATLQLQSVEIRNSFFGDSFRSSGLKTNVATAAAVFGSNILFQDNKYAMFIVGACPAFTQVTINPSIGGANFHPDSAPCSF